MRTDLIKKSRDRSIGFAKSEKAMDPINTVHNRTLPAKFAFGNGVAKPNKARKGRWFVTFVIVSLLGFICVSIWNEFFRYQAYGQLEGTRIELSTAADGQVKAVYVREGDLVEAGQLLVEIDVPELEFQRRQINRNLMLAISDLQVRLAELETQDWQMRADQMERASRYYQLLSQLHQSQSKLEKLRSDFETSIRLQREHAIARSDFIESKTSYEGLKSQVEDMVDAVLVLEPVSVHEAGRSRIAELLDDELKTVKRFQEELNQVDSLLQAKQIRAPVAGRILKRVAEPGERLAVNTLVLEMVESASVEAVIYLPQKRANSLQVGDTIKIHVSPLGANQLFRIVRFSPEIVSPPQAIQANYRAFKGLARVHAKPVTDVGNSNSKTDLTSWVGAELSLPRFGFSPSDNSVQRSVAPSSNAMSTNVTAAAGEPGSATIQLSLNSEGK